MPSFRASGLARTLVGTGPIGCSALPAAIRSSIITGSSAVRGARRSSRINALASATSWCEMSTMLPRIPTKVTPPPMQTPPPLPNLPSYLRRVNRQMQEKVKKLEEELEAKWQQEASENKPKGLKQRIVKLSRSYDPEAKRKKLKEEAFQDGYFDEIKELAKKGEKWWDAEAKMVPAKRAVLTPKH